MMKRKYEKGFTLLEIMIAIAILSLIMLMVSQLMRGEVRMFNNASHQDRIEQKARTAMGHLLDEIRLNRYTYYSTGGGGYNWGVYSAEPDQPSQCLINLKPTPAVLAGDLSGLPYGTKVFYDYSAKKLWYRDISTNEAYLIADEIDYLEIKPETDHLLQIHLKASDASGEYKQELLTWIRMY